MRAQKRQWLKGRSAILLPLSVLLLCAGTACRKNSADPPHQSYSDQPLQIERALFTDLDVVKTGGSSSTIMNELVKYVNNTPKGAVIHLCIYQFNYEPLISAVELASKRGVEVHAMIDYSRSESMNANKNTIDELRPYLGDNLVVVTSDAGPTSIDHHKHVLFSEVDLPEGIATDVVFSTSHNFTHADTKKAQDAVVFTNKWLYDAFLSNWNNMAARASSGMKDFTYTVFRSDSIDVFFFPRRTNGAWDGHDTVLGILDSLTNVSSATIQLAMSDWTVGRLAIAQKLTELESEGAKVEVLITAGKVDAQVVDELEKMQREGGYLKIFSAPVNIHSKFMLITGTWNGKSRKIVINGTHNYTSNALEDNNELLLMLKDSPLFKDYEDYFGRMKQL